MDVFHHARKLIYLPTTLSLTNAVVDRIDYATTCTWVVELHNQNMNLLGYGSRRTQLVGCVQTHCS